MKNHIERLLDTLEDIEKTSGLSFQLEATSANKSAILHINEYPFLVIVRSSVRNAEIGFMLQELQNVNKTEQKPILLNSSYISTQACFEFKKHNYSYIDGSGNVWIKQENLFVSIQGKKITPNTLKLG